MVDASKIVSVATSGAGLMLVTTVIKKLITFGLRQVLVRQVNPTLIGAAEIQLELLLSSLLFLTRESIRMAVLRVDGSTTIKFQHIVNLSWLSPLVIACICVYVVVFQGSTTWSAEVSPLVIQLYCLGALLEACGEPFHNAFRNCLNISASANAETVSVFASSVVTVVTVAYLDMGILGYGLGQVVKGLLDCSVLMYQACSYPIHGQVHGIHAFLPRAVSVSVCGDTDAKRTMKSTTMTKTKCNSYYSLLSCNFDMTSLNLTASSYSTCLFKHLLTQSDKIMLSLTASGHDQGVYAVTHNYAALVTRMVFYPLEESSRLAFAKCSVGVVDGLAEGVAEGEGTRTGIESLDLMKDLFYSRVALVGFIGSVFVLFGPSYVDLFVTVALSPQWRTQATVDSFNMFCYYIAILGVNGITEAFVHAVASPSTYRGWINATLAVSSAVFAATTYGCSAYLSMGTIGVIAGNIASMTVRIGFNSYYIYDYFSSNTNRFVDQTQPIKPKTGHQKANEMTNFLIVFTVACALSQCTMFSHVVHRDSAKSMKDHLQHLCIGLVCVVSYVLILWLICGTNYILSVIRFNSNSNSNANRQANSNVGTPDDCANEHKNDLISVKNVSLNSSNDSSSSIIINGSRPTRRSTRTLKKTQ